MSCVHALKRTTTTVTIKGRTYVSTFDNCTRCAAQVYKNVTEIVSPPMVVANA